MNAVETVGLTKRYGDVTAVDGLDLAIGRGELFSLLGVNGAGKTTAVKMLCGILRPTCGDAFLLGDSIRTRPQAVRAKINISPQETAVARNLTARENLEMVAGIYGATREQARGKAGELLAQLGLTEAENRRAKTLSGGMQRRLSIAMALITSPQILFLDEPTLGVDVLARRELWSAIRRLKGSVTILLTTHYMEEAAALSDRVGIMAAGRLRAVGTPAELMERTGAATLEDAFVELAGKGEGRL